ncbi:MAG: TonB-dependent receptor, partial [Sulfurimonas sp. RIFOXYD2_FULL_37_8]
ELSIYGGSYKTLGGAFYLGHGDEKLSLSASGEAQKSDGIRHINSSTERDEKKLSTVAFNAAYLPIDKVELRAGAATAQVDVIYASYLTLDEYNEDVKQAGATNWGATEQKFDTDAINAGVSYYANQKLSLHADARHEEKRSTYITYSSIADYDYDSAKMSVDFKDDFFSISFGVDMFEGKRDSHANSYAIANETTKENLASFVMSNFNFGNHSIKAGARIEKIEYGYDDALSNLKDDYSLLGSELGYNYALDKKSSVFLNYAHAYQAPDIDRFFNKDWLGNVSFNGFIDPMKTDSFTLGYNNITSKNKFKISLFYIDLEDEIYYYADPSYISSKNTNIDKSHKYGFDVYDKFIISEIFNLALNYNYVKAKIDEEMQNGENYAGKNLPGVSNHNAKATLSYLPTSNIAFALTQSYRSKAYAANDFENNFAQKQDAYTSTDISATYTKDTLELFAKINNLFNQKNGLWVEDNAIYPVDFTTTAMAGLKLKF